MEVKELVEEAFSRTREVIDSSIKIFNNSVLFVVRDIANNKIVGVLVVKRKSERVVNIEGLAVKPEYQRMGIGEHLINVLKEHVKPNDFIQLRFRPDKKLDKFYSELGFNTLKTETRVRIGCAFANNIKPRPR
jgi:N-acetylglutamate synthase-like GNAT family acetyltransferase